MREHFRDGICLIDLSPLTDAALVVPAIAAALGLRDKADESLSESLSRHLQDRHLLLVIDNCEQVLPAASDLATLLARSPHLVILATSRVPLRIRAEREMAIAPLSLPDSGRLPPVPDLERIDAIALFVDRARAARAGFALNEGNAQPVAAI